MVITRKPNLCNPLTFSFVIENIIGHLKSASSSSIIGEWMCQSCNSVVKRTKFRPNTDYLTGCFVNPGFAFTADLIISRCQEGDYKK